MGGRCLPKFTNTTYMSSTQIRLQRPEPTLPRPSLVCAPAPDMRCWEPGLTAALGEGVGCASLCILEHSVPVWLSDGAVMLLLTPVTAATDLSSLCKVLVSANPHKSTM